MITIEEKSELAQLARQDGKRLFGVVEGIYKYLIIWNWVMGIAGGLVGFVSFNMGRIGFLTGIVVWLATASACAANYVFAVLATHGAKVLVHILFSNLAIMEAQQR